MSVLSTNMNLPISTIAVDSGLNWEINLNASLFILDQHDHSSGSGVQIGPAGMNINSDLTMGGNNLTNIRTSRYNAQSAALALATDLGCTYVAGVDLYFNDINGNQIRLTQGGSIVGTAGSISGLPSGTASASFAAGTFVWQSATNTSAVMDAGSIILRNNTASSKGLTLSPPSAMAADFGLTLPSLPGSQKFMTLDASGNMSAPWAVDGSTIVVSAGSVKVPAGGITATQLGAGAVTAPAMGALSVGTAAVIGHAITPPKLSLPNTALSSSSGGYTISSTVYTIPANQFLSITADGTRNIQVTFIGTGPAYFGVYDPGNIAYMTMKILNVTTGTVLVETLFTARASSVGPSDNIPISSLIGYDFAPAVGVNTYQLFIKALFGSTTMYVVNSRMLAIEQ